MIAINLLSSTRVINNGRLRKQKLRKNFFPLLGILILLWIDVLLKTIKEREREREKERERERETVGINMGFFVYDDWILKLF